MPNRLKRVLELHDLVAYGVGGTIGAGIFVSIGVGAVQSGPALFLSFLLAAVACSISGLCFCEMASRVPTSGSSYSYAYKVLGDFPAFVIGSVLVLDSIISAAACARAWTAYVRIVCPFLPSLFGDMQVPGLEHIFSISILSCFVCLGVGTVLALGIKETTYFNNVSTILNALVLAVFILAGLPLTNRANWTPFAPNGIGGIVRGSGRIFFAFLGFDVVNCLAEETGDSRGGAKRLVPRAIMLTIIITTIIYVLVSVAFVGLAPVKSINLSSPLSSALELRGHALLAYLVGIGAVGNTLTSVLSNFLVQPRIMLRMASDGFLPSKLSEIDENGVPRIALLVTVVASAATALLIDFETLADMVSVASLVSLSVVCICSVLVRVKPICWVDEVVLVEPAEPSLHSSRTPPIIESVLDELPPLAANREVQRFEVLLAIYVCLGAVTSAALLHNSPLWLKLVLSICLAISLATACSQFLMLPKDIEISSVSQSAVFRVPLSPLLPLLGVFVNTYLLIGLPVLALIRAAAVFACCGAYYVIVLRPAAPPSYTQSDVVNLKVVKQHPSYDSVS